MLSVTEKADTLNPKVTSYTFDAAGNRATETVTQNGNTTITSYTYNEQNRLTNTTTTLNSVTAQTVTYTYDNNGNELTETTTRYVAGVLQTPQVTTNTYDLLNQLIQTVTADNKTIVNGYNGEGYRTSKSVDGVVTNYLYEYDKVVLETDGDNVQKARNVYGTNLISRNVDGQTAFYLYNGHADVVALVDNTGTIVGTYYYDAFGNIVEQTGNVDNNITYAGYQYDKETGKYYLNARMYDPVTARFMQEDTYRGNVNDPLSLNLYTYCHNEPLMYSDPTGHYAVTANLNKTSIGNADVTTDGKISGNLRDIAKGLGVSDENIIWDSKNRVAKVSNIKDAQSGKTYEIQYNYNTLDKNGNGVGVKYEVGKNGSLSAVEKTNFTVKNGSTQTSIEFVSRSAGSVGYVLYDPREKGGWPEQANNQAISYQKDENNVNNVITVAIEKNDSMPANNKFKDIWNGMGIKEDIYGNKTDTKVQAVSLLFHSADGPHGFTTQEDAKGDNFVTKASGNTNGYYIEDLDSKTIGTINVWSCNSGHLDHTKDNVVVSFLKSNNVEVVYGYDGSTGIYLFDYPRVASDKNQTAFRDYAIDKTRSPEGLIPYRK